MLIFQAPPDVLKTIVGCDFIHGINIDYYRSNFITVESEILRNQAFFIFYNTFYEFKPFFLSNFRCPFKLRNTFLHIT